MEAGKTAALLACSASIGALAAGADGDGRRGAGRVRPRRSGMAFQLVDDILGVIGDPAVTGKSSSSDVRAGKRSAPIVAALNCRDDAASEQLAELLAGGPPTSEHDVDLRDQADRRGRRARLGGSARPTRRLALALDYLETSPLRRATADLAALAGYIVDRDVEPSERRTS